MAGTTFDLKYLLDNLDMQSFQRSLLATFPFFLTFFAIYHLLCPMYTTSKQLSWILTTVTSAIMTIASLPFLWRYFTSGGSVASIPVLSWLAEAANRLFQAYLIADLIIGATYYRGQIALLTGWIHHSLYIVIVEIALRRSWANIFCLCASMELPTFVLGITTLYPRLRSNVLFAVAFFSTRIALHLILCFSYALPWNRPGGSLLPASILASIFPLHAMWFYGCVKGFLRRSRAKHVQSQSPPISLAAIPPEQPSSPMNSSSSSTPVTIARTHPPRLLRYPFIALSVRRASFERVVQIVRLELDHLDEKASARFRDASESIYEALPAREAVFDYLGLGRKGACRAPIARDDCRNSTIGVH